MNVRPEDARSARRPPQRAVSQRRYLVRRVVALVIVSVLIVGLVKGVGALFGGGGDETLDAADPAGVATPTSGAEAEEPAPSTAGGVAPGSTPTGATGATGASIADPPPATAVSPSSAPPPSSAAPAAGPPSAENPARVLVVGDSDAGTFGPYLKTLLDDTGIIETTVDYKVSSGLARPDFFDWPAHLQGTLPTAASDIVVVTFGGNDAQGIALHDGTFPEEWNDPVSDAAEWSVEYERRAIEVLDLLAQSGSSIIWVGIPNDDNPDVTERLAVQDTAAKAAVAARPDVVFIDTWARFSGRTGNWAEYVVDPRDGQGKDVRADDGFHLNENGAEILALDIADAVHAELTAMGAQL